VPVKKRYDVQIWRANPSGVDHAQWRSLTQSLSLPERFKAFEFRFEADRKAYVLAHGLRRLVLAAMLDLPPRALIFRDNEQGQPQLIKPNHRYIYFSHSHTRECVLFAASSDAVVDAENVATGSEDLTLLEPFLVLAELGSIGTGSFYDYWTAQETFWRAAGHLGTGYSAVEFHPLQNLADAPLVLEVRDGMLRTSAHDPVEKSQSHHAGDDAIIDG